MTSGTRALLRAGSGIVSLAVLLATIVLLGPRQWPDHLVPRPSRSERFSPDVRPPGDRKAADLAAAAQLEKTSAPEPVSAPPAAVPPPETKLAAMRPRPPETQAEIPSPRPKESARARDVAGSQNVEASDPSAVIDWLLKGGSSGRRIENP